MTKKQIRPTAGEIASLDDAEEILRRLGDPAAAATVRDARTGLEQYLSKSDKRVIAQLRKMRDDIKREALENLKNKSAITWKEPEYHGNGELRTFIGDLMTLEDWRKRVENGDFIDDDGYGFFARLNSAGQPEVAQKFGHALPSAELDGELMAPQGTTHIIWINR